MQNTKQMRCERRGRSSCFASGALQLVCMIVCVLASLACMAFAHPQCAWADDYTSPQVKISADIQSDGSLHVIEQRSFSFTEETTDISWNWWGFPEDSSYEINGMSIAVQEGEDEDDAVLEDVPAAEYDPDWEEEGEGPGETVYAVDEEDYTTHLYLAESVDYLLVRYDYTIYDALDIYDDYASLSWKYVGRRWDGSSENVVCTISFPVPLEAEGVPNENLFAWGHGPSDASLAFDEGATSVTYTDDAIAREQYAQAHILLPSWWLSNANRRLGNTHHGAEILEKTISAEQDWYDDWCVSNEQKSLLAIRLALLTFALIVCTVLLYLVRGKSHKPDYSETHTCQIPDVSLHPALVSRLWHWNRPSVADVGLCILDLIRKGAIAVNYGSYKLEGDQDSSEIFDYYLSEVPGYSRENRDPIDENILFFLFNEVSAGENSLWLNSLYRYAEENPRRFAESLETWQEMLDERMHSCGYFDKKSLDWQMRLPIVGVLYLLVTAVIAVFASTLWPIGYGLAGALALFLLSNFMPRRSKEGTNVFARYLALRNWLEAPSKQECEHSEAASNLRELAFYAVLFGVEDGFLTDLREANPALFEKAEQEVSQNEAFVPWLGCYAELQSVERKPVAQALREVLEDAYSYAMEAAYAHWGVDDSGD